MNVLLLNAPFHPKFSRSQRSPAVIKSGVMYYPIWLAYATGVLEQDGFNAKLVDAPANGDTLAYVLDLINSFQPRLVVIDTTTPSINNDIEVARAIKDRLPSTFILFVGPHATALPKETLEMDWLEMPLHKVNTITPFVISPVSLTEAGISVRSWE